MSFVNSESRCQKRGRCGSMFGMRNVVKIWRAGLLGAALLGCSAAGVAQDLEQQLQQQDEQSPKQPDLQPRPAAPQLVPRPAPKPADEAKRVQLDVQVEDALGRPVTGLKAADFSVFDNLAPVKDVSVATGGAPGESVEIIFMIDALSSDFEDVARVRQQLSGYLRKAGGHLSHPVTIVWLQKTGAPGKDAAANSVIPIGKGEAYLHVILASQDGLALAKQLDASEILVSGSLAAQGVTSGAVQLSLDALEVLTTGSASRPSRKMLIWMSPGWPLLSQSDTKMREQLFEFVVYMYGELRRARVTVYATDPTGVTTGFNSDGPIRSSNPLMQQIIEYNHSGQTMTDPGTGSYSAYLKSPLNVRQTQPNAMSLPVVAYQTGGLVLDHTNDIGVEIARCVADADAFYTLSYDMPAAKEMNEYHATQVKVDRPGVTVRTRTGYYAQPTGTH